MSRGWRGLKKNCTRRIISGTALKGPPLIFMVANRVSGMGKYISADRHPGVSEARVSGQSLTQFMGSWGCVSFVFRRGPTRAGQKNGSVIHTRVHPHNTRHDVDLNIVLDRLR